MFSEAIVELTVKAVVEPSPVNIFFSTFKLAFPDDAIVIVSVLASVVNVTLLPATNVNVSVALSATTLDCPDIAIVSNELLAPAPAESVPGAQEEPSHFNT